MDHYFIWCIVFLAPKGTVGEFNLNRPFLSEIEHQPGFTGEFPNYEITLRRCEWDNFAGRADGNRSGNGRVNLHRK